MASFQEFLPYSVPLLIAITFHEAAHGFVAYLLGDVTAKRLNRVSFNPFRHIDPMGTVFIPAMLALAHSPVLFGYAKPVPVNFLVLKGRQWGQMAVALAGPAINLILAFISALALHLETIIMPEQHPWLFQGLYISVAVNIVLAVFNMLPILPLDGGRVLNALMPPRMASLHAKTERWGMFVVLALLLFPSYLQERGIIENTAGYYLIQCPADGVMDVIYRLAGIGIS